VTERNYAPYDPGMRWHDAKIEFPLPYETVLVCNFESGRYAIGDHDFPSEYYFEEGFRETTPDNEKYEEQYQIALQVFRNSYEYKYGIWDVNSLWPFEVTHFMYFQPCNTRVHTEDLK
jgi:hypothetical protein